MISRQGQVLYSYGLLKDISQVLNSLIPYIHSWACSKIMKPKRDIGGEK